MKPLIILFVAVSNISFGQIEKQINSILLRRDFKLFLDFAKNYSIEKKGVRIDKENIREVVDGYQEAMFTISKAYQMYKGISITTNPKLRVITHNTRIIYFCLESKEIKDFQTYEITSDTTYRYIDVVQMTEFKKRFKFVYKSSLNDSDLFIDTIAVGTKCGFYPGGITRQHEQILKWVQAKDTANIFNWLQSANTEKQVYAVKGLYYLSLRRITISEEKRSIANRVRRKKGTIYTCIPCDTRETLIVKELEAFPL